MHIPEKLKHIFTIIITVLISVALTLLVVLFTVEHLTGRYIASFINTSLPEIIERKIETKKVSITLLTGSLTFKNLSVSSIKFLSKNIENRSQILIPQLRDQDLRPDTIKKGSRKFGCLA